MRDEGVTTERDRPIGILAGGGGLPLEIAHGIVARGGRVQIVSLAGETEADFGVLPHVRVGWGEVGRLLGTFKAAGVRDLVIIGAVTRPDLTRLWPDLGLIRRLPKIIRIITAGGDDGVLRRVVGVLEGEGFRVLGPDQVAPELVCRAGPIAGPAVTDRIRADARLGFEVVAALGPYDIGQAVVVSAGRIVAIEGAEGTDRLLRRLAGHPGAVGGVLVKRPKPSQDLRVDLPAIGPDTVTRAHAAGLAAIVVEADRVIRAGRDEITALAERLGIAIDAIDRTEVPETLARIRPAPISRSLVPWSKASRLRRLAADAGQGAKVAATLAHYGAGHAVVVARRHVLAVAGEEPTETVLDRVSALRQWGDGRRRVRRGVLVTRGWPVDGGSIECVMERAAAAGLAGVAWPGSGPEAHPDLVTRARDHGLEVLPLSSASARPEGETPDA